MFKIDSSASSYSTIIANGFNMWGSYISESQSSSSTSVIKAQQTPPEPYVIAATLTTYSGFTGHISKWTIFLYKDEFVPLSTRGKTNAIGHEVGHAFGLDHIGSRMNPQSLMKEDLDTAITTPAPKDYMGMRVVTHNHITHTWNSGNICTVCYGSKP